MGENKKTQTHKPKVQTFLGIPMTMLDEKTQKVLDGLRAEKNSRHKDLKKRKYHGVQNRNNNTI